jgi:hypothetical protein
MGTGDVEGNGRRGALTEIFNLTPGYSIFLHLLGNATAYILQCNKRWTI